MKTKAPPRAAGVVVFRRTGNGIYLLILRAYKNWDFPKGLVDPGEDQLAAAKRELKEETGLAGVDFPFGEEYRETLPYAGNKIARYYLGETDAVEDRKSTRLNSSHSQISYAVFCLKKKTHRTDHRRSLSSALC